MRDFLVTFVTGLLLLGSCKRTSESLYVTTPLNKTTAIDTASSVLYPRHEITYANDIRHTPTKLKLSTSFSSVTCSDTVISYHINPVSQEVLRACASRTNKQIIRYLLLNGNRIGWDHKFGKPNEFIGQYLFSDVYRGGELGGTITKFKFKLLKDQLIFMDSIPGGGYSEGAGTWEWLISHAGDHKAIIFHGGDVWSTNNNKLLITPEGSSHTYLIDFEKNDTLHRLTKKDGHTWHQLITESGLLFAIQSKPRLNYLRLYNLNGQMQWEAKSDYLEKIVVDQDRNLIIASGYFFPKADNTQRYFTVAYEGNSGQIKWSFPTSKAYDAQQMHTSRVNTSNLFKIMDNVYGMVVGQVSLYFGQNINHSNRLILFDADGAIYEVLDLSMDDQDYSVVTRNEQEFEIVSRYETRTFRINP